MALWMIYLFSLSNIHHAPGILADQLVRRVMLDAATVVDDDHLRDEAAYQEYLAVDHIKSE